MLLALLTFALATVPETAPPALDLTEDEASTVAKGKIAIRFTDDDSGGGVVGVMDLDAPPDRVWDAVLDVKARVGEISGLREVNVYEDTPSRKSAQWVLSMFATRVEFHIAYDVDPAKRWCRYRLDTSRENDVVDVQGAYQIYSVGPKTRLVYRSETDSGRRVPGFIKRWLASDSLTEQMEGIRARAEAN